tara:strand:- start:47878 stop:48801 length:924 start_codon:yes stop_codon:yes gene_type:complete
MKKLFFVCFSVVIMILLIWTLSPNPSNLVITQQQVKELSPNQPPQVDHVRFHNIILTEKNECGQTRESTIRVFDLVFFAPLELTRDKLRIIVTEEVSGNQQEIFFDGNSFLYKKLNANSDVQDFGVPEKCISRDPCPFFVKVKPEYWKNLKREVRFSVNIFNSNNQSEPALVKKYDTEENQFLTSFAAPRNEISVLSSFDPKTKTVYAYLPKTPVIDQLNKSTELYLVIQTKNKVEQNFLDKFEFDVNLFGLEKRIRGDNFEYKTKINSSDPAYLNTSFYMIRKNLSEAHSVISINKSDPFFNCSQQ